MIVSASRRTDIPALYAPWLLNRLEAGYAEVPNPFDPNRIRRVDLLPPPDGEMEVLALWTRDPSPLLDHVTSWEARGVRSLWLVTVTGYPGAMEPGAPRLDAVGGSVRRLAEAVGPDRVIWRYDPLLLCPQIGLDIRWHLDKFRSIAEHLAGATRRCIVSYYDDYAKARRRLTAAGLSPDDETEAISLAAALLSIAGEFGVTVQSCCEDLEPAGLSPGACIDGALIDRLWGLAAGDKRDPGQRPRCRCAPSVDIGVYHTCTHGCLYCYATGSPNQVAARRRAHSPQGERLA